MPIQAFELASSETPGTKELHVTAVPAPGGAAAQAEEVFSKISAVLRREGGQILQERIFLTSGATEDVVAARRAAYGDLDDGVPPAWLQASPGLGGPLVGVQVHAVVGGGPPQPVELDAVAVGRVLRVSGLAFLTTTALSAPQAGVPADQACAVFEQGARVAERVGMDMFSVARTWIWLRDILSWYDELNAARNEFFRRCGMLDAPSGQELPASTGIGVAPTGEGQCAMEMIAMAGPDGELKNGLLAAGNQGPAFAYGSAFSRALQAKTPAGSTVYVSGTAAIDAQGATRHVGNIPGQIEDTIANVRAVLDNMGCGDGDVVNAMMYCKTAEVEQAFGERRGELCWPGVVMVCDICRKELLFEIEVTACPGARKL